MWKEVVRSSALGHSLIISDEDIEEHSKHSSHHAFLLQDMFMQMGFRRSYL